jgi:hypothetical protein
MAAASIDAPYRIAIAVTEATQGSDITEDIGGGAQR